jgi:hypothetical protein
MRQLSERNYEACLAHAVDFVRSHSRTSEVLVVGATTEAAAEVVRLACDTALVGVHAISLRNLARVLAESRLCASGLTPISALGREALIRSITPSAKLHYLAPIAGMPGFARAVSRTLRELRMNDEEPEGDLRVLLDAYLRELEAKGFADVATEFAFAAQEQEHPFCGMPVVFLDVPVPHALEKRLVDKLSAAGLLLTRNGEFAPPNASIFSASSEALECVEIARRCLTSGLPFDRIAVLSRDAARMQPLLEEAFQRAGVPAYFTLGCLRPSSSGRAMLALLHCAAEGMSERRYREFRSLGQSSDVKPRPLLEALPKSATWGEWLEALEELSPACGRRSVCSSCSINWSRCRMSVQSACKKLWFCFSLICARCANPRKGHGTARYSPARLRMLAGCHSIACFFPGCVKEAFLSRFGRIRCCRRRRPMRRVSAIC